jgi:hypothetical protein
MGHGRDPVRRVLGIALALAVFALAPAVAQAQNFKVTRLDDPSPNGCAPGDCSLREAVIDANAASGADKILLKRRTYRLTIPGLVGTAQGDLDISDDVTIKTQRGGRAEINANGPITGDRAFELFGAGTNVVMKGLEVTRGRAPIDVGPNESFGGGIRVHAGASLEFSKGVIDDNRNDGSVVNLGGGIFNDGTVHLVDSRVTGNEAPPASFAGGINTSAGATTTLLRTTVKNNTAGFGGGMNSSGHTTMAASTVSGNDAGLGGAIYAGGNGSVVTISNSTLSGNQAADRGGAIRARSGPSFTLASTTVSDNTANSATMPPFLAGAISFQSDGGFTTTFTLRNTILAGNIDVGAGNITDCQIQAGGGTSTLVSQGHNLIGNGDTCPFAPGPGDQVGTGASPVNPKLGALKDNGGLTQTQALLGGSPAINAGDPGALGSGGTACPKADQRGAGRDDCDIGGYERVKCEGVVVNRVGTNGRDILAGTPGDDGFLAFGGNDLIRARGGDDGACGGAGKDLEKGGAGKDRLSGGPDNDVLDGGPGNDSCDGGPGRDTLRSC